MREEAFEHQKAEFAILDDREIVEVLDRGYATTGYAGAAALAAETLTARSNTTTPAFSI